MSETVEGQYTTGDELTIDVEMNGERGEAAVEVTREVDGGYVVEANGTKLGTLRDNVVSSLPGIAQIAPATQFGDVNPWPVYSIEEA